MTRSATLSPCGRVYRVVWLRAGLRAKAKERQFRTLKGAERFARLFGPEPWTAFGKKPDDYLCCSELLYSADSMAWSFAARRRGGNANDWREAQAFAEAVEAQAFQRPLLFNQPQETA